MQLAKVVRTEFKVRGGEVLLKALDPPGSRDRDDPRLLREQPRQRDLTDRGALALQATVVMRSTRARLACRASCWKTSREERGCARPRRTATARSPDRSKAASSGLNGTKPMPTSARAGVTFGLARNSEYSLCNAVIGCTAWARRSVLDTGLGQAEVARLAGVDEVLDGAGDLLESGRWGRRRAG